MGSEMCIRDSHEGDLVGKEAARTGKPVRDVVLERGLLSAEEYDRIMTRENYLKPRYTGRTYSPSEHVLSTHRSTSIRNGS